MTCWLEPTKNQASERDKRRAEQARQVGGSLKSQLDQLKGRPEQSQSEDEDTDERFDWGKFRPGQSREVGGGSDL